VGILVAPMNPLLTARHLLNRGLAFDDAQHQSPAPRLAVHGCKSSGISAAIATLLNGLHPVLLVARFEGEQDETFTTNQRKSTGRERG
jgi:hypothetical protein